MAQHFHAAATAAAAAAIGRACLGLRCTERKYILTMTSKYTYIHIALFREITKRN